MFAATQAIADALRERNVTFKVEDMEKISAIRLTFAGDNVSSCTIHFISKDDGNDFALRIFKVAHAPEEKRDEVLKTVNECNATYRHLKFIMDKDGDVNVEFDSPVMVNNPGEVAFEMLSRAMHTVDEAYPKFMRVIWG